MEDKIDLLIIALEQLFPHTRVCIGVHKSNNHDCCTYFVHSDKRCGMGTTFNEAVEELKKELK